MKKLIAMVVGIFWFGIIHAESDSIYIMKSGKVIHRQSTKAEVVDSIIFYHPGKAAPKPGSPMIAGQNDTMYIMKSGKVTHQQSIKEVDVDSIVFELPIHLPPQIILSTEPIPAGTFLMGSPVNEPERGDSETQHWVTISAFRLSKYETTNAEFAQFLNSKKIGSDARYAAGAYPNEPLVYASDWNIQFSGGQWVPVSGYQNYPINHVTWFGATEFAAYKGGRLPTESEWEYACRANGTIYSPFYTGACLTNLQANYDWSNPYASCTNANTNKPGKTQPVGMYPPNNFGLYDMHGNVWEWCSDWFGTYPTIVTTDPKGPATGQYRVFRGGGWSNIGTRCRSAMRYVDQPIVLSSATVGLRVAFDVP